MKVKYTVIEAPPGPILAAESDLGLIRVVFGPDVLAGLTDFCRKCLPDAQIIPAAIYSASQIEEYLAGDRREFDLPLDLRGTDFQLHVWQVLREIPYGRTMSYGQVAAAIGRSKGARAVGGACGANPIPLVIPCHRVLGSDGGLHGFSSGLDWKKWLLRLEGHPAGRELNTGSRP